MFLYTLSPSVLCSHRVTILDNLSRGNLGAVTSLNAAPGARRRLRFVQADLGDPAALTKLFKASKVRPRWPG